ncbi:MAG: hypothetical protein QXZ13_01015 [Candidatus Diapherotrites archaeon]
MNKKTTKTIAMFIISYLAIIIISELNYKAENKLPLRHIDFSNFPTKVDYSLVLLPIIGFFFVYMLIPHLKDFGFGNKFKKYVFPILFLTFSILGFYLAVYVYYLDVGLRIGLGFDLSQFKLNYFDMFLNSTFIYFVIAGLFGWLSRLLIEKFEK